MRQKKIMIGFMNFSHLLGTFFVVFFVQVSGVVPSESAAASKNQHSANQSSKNAGNNASKNATPKKTSKEDKQPESAARVAQTGSSPYNIPLPTTTAKHAYLLDIDSGIVLFELNAHEQMSPSSMTKIATACFVASKLKLSDMNLDTKFTVSRQAYRKEGSTMFLNIGQQVSVEELLNGLIVSSGNDAAVTLAEGFCGSEAVFASELTSWVRSFGAVHTNFVNGSGLPSPEHKTTAYDLALISIRAIKDFPEFFHLYSKKSFTFNGVTQPSKNELLRRDIGCDGLKTGHTNDGGYGVVATTIQDGRRLLLVVNGYASEQERVADACSLLSWGAKTFINHYCYKSNALIAKIPVWYGEESELPVSVENDVVITLPRSAQYDAKIVLRYESPVAAPIQKGTQVGEIIITSKSMGRPIIVPLVASISVKEGGFFKKLSDSFTYLVWGARKPTNVGAPSPQAQG
jgi:D-alanyl-D-alanine carboxypeptidase (penicillin-binding protein 5/6)